MSDRTNNAMTPKLSSSMAALLSSQSSPSTVSPCMATGLRRNIAIRRRVRREESEVSWLDIRRAYRHGCIAPPLANYSSEVHLPPTSLLYISNRLDANPPALGGVDRALYTAWERFFSLQVVLSKPVVHPAGSAASYMIKTRTWRISRSMRHAQSERWYTLVDMADEFPVTH